MTLEFISASDCSLLLQFTSGDRRVTQNWILRLTRRLAHLPAEGQRSISPGAGSLLVRFDPRRTSHSDIEGHLLEQLEAAGAEGEPVVQTLEIPVWYDPRVGPDFDFVQAQLGLSSNDLIELHSNQEYQVLFVGFSPGFSYLGRVSPQLRMPRKTTPRPLVPAGSVAIAADYTGIYPTASPGGWWVIGRTPIKMFDLSREPAILAGPGDQVRLRPVTEQEFLSLGGSR